jgi:hypothetical protein
MDELDELCRKIVRKERKCYVCGREGTDVAHLFVRNKLGTRWDLRNLRLLCRICHNESHDGGEIYKKKYIEKEGVELYDAVCLASNTMVGNVGMFIEETRDKLLREASKGIS